MLFLVPINVLLIVRARNLGCNVRDRRGRKQRGRKKWNDVSATGSTHRAGTKPHRSGRQVLEKVVLHNGTPVLPASRAHGLVRAECATRDADCACKVRVVFTQ